MANPNTESDSRLGTDPFAALGMAPDVRSSSKTAPGSRPTKKRPKANGGPKPAATKPRTAAARKSQPGAKRPATKAAATPPAGPTQNSTARQVDVAAIEDRLADAFRHLRSLPLPDGPPSPGVFDEFLDLVGSTLRFMSPIYYYEAWNKILFADRSVTVDPFGLDPVFEERAERLADFFYRKWWRVDATGVNNIPAGGRALLVSNHSGMLPYDGAMIKHAVRVQHPARRTVRFLVENFVFYFPVLGTLMYRYGGVRASQDNAVRLLNDDQLTAVFPEGVKGLGKHYRHRYQLQRFGRGGFIKLALRTGSPIVPVAVVGAEEIHPIIGNANFLAKPLRLPYVPITPTFPLFGLAGLIPLPTKWTIQFGEPMDFPLEYGPDDVDNEILVNELTLKVRRVIHEMIYDQLAGRGSVFLG